MDELESIRKHLSSLGSLRKIFADMSPERIEEILNKITSILDEVKETWEKKELEALEKEEKRQQIQKMMAEIGLSVDQLGTPITADNLTKKRKSSRASTPIKAKFAMKDSNGSWQTYSRGRLATWVKEALATGTTEEQLSQWAEQYNSENNL
ncbi:H-NS family nucleoid-associated regulatory protein [Providencia alcalifaciens]|uniref:H-NS family histone-like protein n=1 Tax=Providencia alcalifaciens TaxID=126385 RepID=UPI0032DA7AEE